MTDTEPRRPGEWPVPRTFLPAEDEREYASLRNQGVADQARWTVTLSSIRSHLECPHCHPAPGMDHLELRSIRGHLNEQPSPQAIRAAARHWRDAITQIAEDLINTRRTER